MTAEPRRVGVIGLGKLGLLHAATFNVLPGSRTVALADTSRLALGVVREHLPDVRAFADHGELIASGEVDAVVIATPTGSHVPIALACAERGVPFLVEKPLSTTAAQAVPLLDALAARPVVNMVGYMTRRHETFRKAKALLDGGALGRPLMLQATMYVAQLFGRGKGWRYERASSGGGVLMTQNTHLLDLLLWLFGPVRRVNGRVRRLYSSEIEDYAHAYLEFSSGLVGFLDSSWSMRGYRTPTIEIRLQCEGGVLSVSDDEVVVSLEAAGGGLPAGATCWRKPDLYEPVSFDIGGPFYTRQAELFLAALAGSAEVDTDVRSAYLVQCLVDAIYRSADAEGAPVEVSGGRRQ